MHDIRTEMMLTMIECGIDVEAQHHEVATGGQCEIDMHFCAARRHGRQRAEVQVHRQERRQASTTRRSRSCPSRCSATTARGMHVHFSLWKSGKNLFAGSGYAGLSRHGPVRHRRPAQARPGPVRLHQSDDQQLQAARARLRGAGQSRLQPAQSLGRDPHSRVLAEAQGRSASSSAAPTARQSVPGLRRRC